MKRRNSQVSLGDTESTGSGTSCIILVYDQSPGNSVSSLKR